MPRIFPTEALNVSYVEMLRIVRELYILRNRPVSSPVSLDDAEIYFESLCKLFNFDPDEVVKLFDKVSIAGPTQLSKFEADRSKAILHPTFLDMSMVQIVHVTLAEDVLSNLGVRKNGSSSLLQNVMLVELKDIMYVFNSMPRNKKHAILQSIDLDAFDNSAPKTTDLLYSIREGILELEGFGKRPLPEPSNSIDLQKESLRSLTKEYGGEKANKHIIRQLQTIFNQMNKLDRAELAAIKALDYYTVNYALKAAEKLSELREQYKIPEPISPADIMDNLTGATISDPLLFVWSLKAAEEESDRKSLLAYWNDYINKSIMPKHDAVIRALLARADAVDPKTGKLEVDAMNLPGFARTIGVTVASLRDILFSDKPRNVWETNGTEWVPKGDFANFCTQLVIEDDQARKLIAPPARSPIIKPAEQEITARKPVVVDDYSVAKERFGKDPAELVDAAIALMKPGSAKNIKRAREELLQALKNSDAMKAGTGIDAIINQNGLPSMPHLWLMWSINDDTRYATTPAETLKALAETFRVKMDSENSPFNDKDAFGFYVWNVVQVARQAGTPAVINYGDYFKATKLPLENSQNPDDHLRAPIYTRELAEIRDLLAEVKEPDFNLYASKKVPRKITRKRDVGEYLVNHGTPMAPSRAFAGLTNSQIDKLRRPQNG